MSQFTAKVGKSTDKVNALNDYAVKNLEGIAEQRQNPPTLPNRMLLAISPFAAFRPPNADDSEEQVKKIVIDTANGIADKVKVLQSASFDITHSLDTIQSTLDRIQELAVDEIGTQPRMDVLGALWARLAHPDDYKEHKSHSSLLTDMTSFYESASYVMQETTASLNGVEANLDEFYDDLSTPGLTLRDQPLEIIVAQFKGSSRRLEASKEKLELIEGGERPRGDDVKKVVTKTVAVTSA